MGYYQSKMAYYGELSRGTSREADIIKDNDKDKWEEKLKDKGVEELDRKMFLDPAIGDVLLGKDVGKPLDSKIIVKLASL